MGYAFLVSIDGQISNLAVSFLCLYHILGDKVAESKTEVQQRLYIPIQLKSAMVVGIYTIALRSGFIYPSHTTDE